MAKYKIVSGFNVKVEKPWTGERGRNLEIVTERDAEGNPVAVRHEARFEPDDGPLDKRMVPAHTNWLWLISKGVLVEIIEEEPDEALPESEVNDG